MNSDFCIFLSKTHIINQKELFGRCMQMLHHLFEKNVPMTKVDGVVVVLVEQCDEMKQMMVSTILHGRLPV